MTVKWDHRPNSDSGRFLTSSYFLSASSAICLAWARLCSSKATRSSSMLVRFSKALRILESSARDPGVRRVRGTHGGDVRSVIHKGELGGFLGELRAHMAVYIIDRYEKGNME